MLKNLGMIAISVLVTLGLVEIGLRLFDPLNFEPHASRKQANVSLVNDDNYFCVGGPRRLQPHDTVYSREIPNQTYFEFRNEFSSIFDINEYGFRGSFDAPDGKQPILVLGDSFIRGTLSDESETIPALLSRWSEDAHFLNFGTGGHGTLQHALTYDEFKDQFPHDTVLLFILNRNDLIDNVRFRKWQNNPGPRQTAPTLVQRLKRSVAKLYVGKLLMRFQTLVLKPDQLPSTPTATEQDLFFESIQSLADAVDAQGARLFVISLPDVSEFVGTDRVTFRADPIGYSDAVRGLIDRAAAENGLVWFDVKPALTEFASTRGIDAADLYGFPDAHQTELGNYAVASLVARFLQDNDLATFEIEGDLVDLTHYDPDNVSCP